MSNDEKLSFALSFETINATVAAATMEQFLDLLKIIEGDLDDPKEVLLSFKSLVGLAMENAKRDADKCLFEDLRHQQPEGLPST